MKTDLSKYNNSWYKPGSSVKRGLWYLCNIFIFKSSLFPFSSLKCNILRLFGAKIGNNVLIKPGVNIKYPWFLTIGDNTWIGEDVWIDNLAEVKIGRNVCLSQGSFVLCGNHNYKSSTFNLKISPITLEDGVWIGAKAIVGPGSYCNTHSVLTLNSVGSKVLQAYGIYTGNPAILIKQREISE